MVGIQLNATPVGVSVDASVAPLWVSLWVSRAPTCQQPGPFHPELNQTQKLQCRLSVGVLMGVPMSVPVSVAVGISVDVPVGV